MSRLVIGRIRGMSQRSKESALEALEIWVPQDFADGLPFVLGQPVRVAIRVAGKQYTANLRSTPDNPNVFVSRTVFTERGDETALANVLGAAGFHKNDRVGLEVNGTTIEIRKLAADGTKLPVTPEKAQKSASKYVPLVEHLASAGADKVRLTFAEIERILGFRLPSSARKYWAWWSNSRTEDTHTWAHLWLDAGWEREELNLTNEWVTFRRVQTDFSNERDGKAERNSLRDEDAAETANEDGGDFNPDGMDRRALVERQIRERRGQAQFRDSLRTRYGNRCLVTGCEILAVLEAAHIKPYRGEGDNDPANGLLLRADIHTLFDLDLLGIEPEGLRIRLHPGIAAEYGRLEGKTLRCLGQHHPSEKALKRRFELFCQRLGVDER
jgi:HNH endonuclease